MAAENYHLKWDSHLSYLNSSVSTLYKNEKFADVVLYSSSSSSCGNGNNPENGIPTVGISAHKFILSSCSQFFATMFETAPISSPSGVLYIVLPPDLSHRAIQILVQYMYSGEATVANDILSEVLRGGEILKIRGLCRTSTTSNSQNLPSRNESLINNGNGLHYIQNGTNRQQTLPPITHSNAHIPSAHSGDIYVNKCHTSIHGNCRIRYPIDHTNQSAQPQPHHIQPIHNQFRGLGASVLPKDSPVIVKSPKLSQLGLLSAVATSTKHQTGGSISVNKEVAIDPEEKCCYQLNNLPVTTSLCNEMGCSGGCPMSIEDEHITRRQRIQNDETIRSTVVEQQLEREYSDRSCPPPPDEPDQRGVIDMVSYDRNSRLRRTSGGSSGERIRDYFLQESYENTNTTHTKNNSFSDQLNGRFTNNSPISHTHTFLEIKQEPTDWTTTDNLSSRPKTPLHSPKQPLDFKIQTGGTTVKLEVAPLSHSPGGEDDNIAATKVSEDYDNRLACETCKQSFDEPKSWVRHLESHTINTTTTTTRTRTITTETSMGCNSTNMSVVNSTNTANNGGDGCGKAYVPKKRRRISQQENNAGHVTLCCDLCSISFETPADWVRHISNEHTEIELAMFNSKKDSENKSTVSNSHQSHQQAHLKRFNHRSTYEQPVNEAPSAGASGPSTSNYSEHSETCGKQFSPQSGILTHKRNLNALNDISVSVSTNVASSSSQSSNADISVISNSASSLPNGQISASSQA